MSDFSQSRSFNVGISVETSIEAAVIYEDLAYAQRVFGDGYFFRSDEQMLLRFPFMSKNTIRRHVAKLVDAGYISTKVKKASGIPKLHYQIEQVLLPKMSKSMEIPKMGKSLLEDKESISKASNSSFGAESSSDATAPATANPVTNLLVEIINIVNPKEKPTDERKRMLHARLKDYTTDEIVGSAKYLAKSEWHRENKQMSIDNLLAPSKFGRWFAQFEEGGNIAAPVQIADIDEKLEQERKELEEKNKDRDWGFGDEPK